MGHKFPYFWSYIWLLLPLKVRLLKKKKKEKKWRGSFAPLNLFCFPALVFCFLNRVETASRLQLHRCSPELQRQNEPQHAANPTTSMQRTTVGLTGIRNPPLTAAHTEQSRKVRHRKKKKVCGEREEGDVRPCSLTPLLLLLLWAVMSGFCKLINTKHTVWLRAVVIDYLANRSCAVSIRPIC